MNNLKQKVLFEIENIYKHGDIKYAIWNYVDRDFWDKHFKEWFPNLYSYNETDFNYSVCFTMYLNISPTKSEIGTEDFNDYINKNKEINLLAVDISVIVPYAIFKYMQYKLINGKKEIFIDYKPFNTEHAKYGNKVKEELEKKGITILEDEILFAKVDPEISLELRKKDVRVENCLFDDSETWPK